MTFIKLILLLLFLCKIQILCFETCSIITDENKCSSKLTKNLNRYILYDVNPPEGFNLRRDVYMRFAVFVHNLKATGNELLFNFKLVLPPWSRLYHWTSDHMHIPWSHFFDLESLQRFAPVIEMYQFFNEVGNNNYEKIRIDEVFILQNFDDMFKTGKFEDKLEIETCTNEKSVNFFHYLNVTSMNIKCLSFHGHVSQLVSILQHSNSKSIMFNHGEIVLHDRYGDGIYWQARRSMRFNKQLRAIADAFRHQYLNSTNRDDNINIPDNWIEEENNARRDAHGGPYLCVHLRRRDFLWGRANQVPDIEHAAQQIQLLLDGHNLTTVFIATDATTQEYTTLYDNLIRHGYKVLKYNPLKDLINLHEGAIAIIDQIICSHAYFFIGTHESTFTYRIQEEREILGFPTERTFNHLCPSKNQQCQKPSIWKIVY